MTDSHEPKCPECGALIPEGAPGDLCPRCLMSLGTKSDTEPPEPPDKPTSGKSTVLQDAFSPTDRWRSSTSQRFFRLARWALLGTFVLIATVFGLRELWVESHFRPSFILADDLSLVFDTEQLGLTAEHRLTAVDGTPISTMEEAQSLFNDAADRRVSLSFTAPSGETREILFAHYEPPFYFGVGPDRTVVFEPDTQTADELIEDEEAIVAVNGVPLDALDELPQGGYAVPRPASESLLFHRFTTEDAATGDRREVVVHAYSSSAHWARYVGGLALLGIGLLTFWLRPNRKSVLGFLFFCTVLGLFFLFRGIPFWYRVDAENFAYLIAQCTVPASFIVLLATFTPMRSLIRRPGHVLIPSALTVLLFLVGNFLFFPKLATYGLLGMSIFKWWILFCLGLLLISLPMDWWLSLIRMPVSPSDRQRAWVLRIAVLCGVGPSVLYHLLSNTVLPNLPVSNWPLVTDLAIFLFPAIIGYAVVRQNFLRLSDLAMEGLTYGIFLMAVSIAYLSSTAIAIPLLESIIPIDGSQARTFLLIACFGVVLPTHNLTRNWVERRFKRVSLEFDQFLAELENEKWSTSTEYCQAAASQLSRMTRTPHVAIFRHEPKSKSWSLSGLSPGGAPGVNVEECTPLLNLIEEREAVVFRDDLVEDLSYRSLQGNILTGFRILDAAVLVPLVSQGRVVGVIALGYKADETNYSPRELNTLRRISAHIARTLTSLSANLAGSIPSRIADNWPKLPDRIGGYQIERALGEGGMGYVFLGTRSDVQVAIKVANLAVQNSADAVERFHREASAIQRINHTNVVEIIEVGWEGPEPFIVLEYLSKGSLDQWLDDQTTVPVKEAVSISLQIVRGLKAASEKGIIHRDIKPRNIFRTGEGVVKIGDFGLARIADRTTLTQEGQIFGTPDYIAPEILLGESASIQSDQYALGVTLYEMLTKRRPFMGENVQSVWYQRVNTPAPEPRQFRPDLDERICGITMQLLQAEPENRFPSYNALVDELEAALAQYDISGYDARLPLQ